MGVILVLAASILYPALLYRIFRLIHDRSRLRMYWIIVPLSLAISLSIPFLYSYYKDSSVLVSLETMVDYSLKSGLMTFLVIPSLTAALICTLYGYLRISRVSVVLMSAICIAGIAGVGSGGSMVERLLNEPAIRWEQLGPNEVSGADFWIFGDGQHTENRYVKLNEQETDQVRAMLNAIPGSAISEVRYAERTLTAEIGLSLNKNDSRTIRIQYDEHELYAAITDKRSQKYFSIQSGGLKAFFDQKLQK
ncbi:hypothetical protein R70723_13265 [Paenibacillus sp. FSL R7-0273]|uniref:hypothetical protein n=1 Tax=Paenibacillus sp. FSL R7-0273 TaxID=1536772 RepID=UPI0004F8FDC4|nr:hypothetical protein [Paenibacillus sp. FSL R7-0273]AIQ46731.1 hypothetical protein R70723_13265 [Paenibacillus sp. FSL R7-0273]OMF97500.1 hypothetical protein BK144_02325 [Paenibacillus sp. FSL R7-0273]